MRQNRCRSAFHRAHLIQISIFLKPNAGTLPRQTRKPSTPRYQSTWVKLAPSPKVLAGKQARDFQMTGLGPHATDSRDPKGDTTMWKQLWQTWTIDKPAALGDWLHQILVVELAALLDRLTLRQVIAFIPVVILVIAYAHSIPIPPELMLVGDLLAYLDIFSILLLLSVIGRVTAILYVIRQMADRVLRLMSLARQRFRRPDSARRAGVMRRRKPSSVQPKDEDGGVPAFGLAWA